MASDVSGPGVTIPVGFVSLFVIVAVLLTSGAIANEGEGGGGGAPGNSGSSNGQSPGGGGAPGNSGSSNGQSSGGSQSGGTGSGDGSSSSTGNGGSNSGTGGADGGSSGNSGQGNGQGQDSGAPGNSGQGQGGQDGQSGDHGRSGERGSPGDLSSHEPKAAVDEEVGRAKSHEEGLEGRGNSPRIHDMTPSLQVQRTEKANVLEWAAPPGDEAPVGYQIWRSNSPFALLATVDGEQTNFKDVDGPPESKYKVTAFFETSPEGGYLESATALSAAPDWSPDVYKTAIVAIVIPSLGARLTQGLGLGAGLMLVTLGLAVGRYDLLIRGGRLVPRREGAVRLVSVKVRSEEIVRFLDLWEESGRPFPLEPSTMQVWTDYRQALVDEHGAVDQTSL